MVLSCWVHLFHNSSPNSLFELSLQTFTLLNALRNKKLLMPLFFLKLVTKSEMSTMDLGLLWL